MNLQSTKEPLTVVSAPSICDGPENLYRWTWRRRFEDYFYQLRLSHEFNPDWKLQSVIKMPKWSALQPNLVGRWTYFRASTPLSWLYKSLAQTELLGKVDTSWARHDFQPSLVNSTISKTSFVANKLNKHNWYLPTWIWQIFLAPFTDTKEQQRYFALNVRSFLMISGVCYLVTVLITRL